jgi:hypothetical protein
VPYAVRPVSDVSTPSTTWEWKWESTGIEQVSLPVKVPRSKGGSMPQSSLSSMPPATSLDGVSLSLLPRSADRRAAPIPGETESWHIICCTSALTSCAVVGESLL